MNAFASILVILVLLGLLEYVKVLMKTSNEENQHKFYLVFYLCLVGIIFYLMIRS